MSDEIKTAAQPAAPQVSPARPDAVKISTTYGKGGVPRGEQGNLVAVAERLLGVDKTKGELARVRAQNGCVFATRDPSQKLSFPDNHELRGQSRYDWTDRGDGVQVGTLTAAAREGV